MIFQNAIFLFNVSLFHSKFRECAIFCLELTNALLIAVLSIALFDHILKDTDYGDSNQLVINDNFPDLVAYLNAPRSNGNSDSLLPVFESVIVPDIFNESDNPTLAEVMGIEIDADATTFERFQLTFRKQEMYREGDPLIDELLYDLARWPIESVELFRGGTQIKMYVNFTNNAGRAMMKPMKCPREQETLKNRYMFRDLERHNAEIAAFHLDRALGFRRTAPVVGRIINMTSEIEEICDEEFKETFFISPDNNKCFHGFNCSQYCGIEHPVCGNPDMIEVAMMAYLPFFNKTDERHFVNPWRRAYHTRKKADWTKDDEWCDAVQLEDTYYPGTRRIFDVIDMHILDFLMTNQDRHHYEALAAFGVAENSTSAIIHLDHGRSFGRAFWDDHVILTPIRQCCLIRNSTLATLLRYHNGPIKLSEHMRKSMANDPIAPVLWEPHYEALDRRVGLILQEIRNCIDKTIPEKRLKYEADELAYSNYSYSSADNDKANDSKLEPSDLPSFSLQATKLKKENSSVDKFPIMKRIKVPVVLNKDKETEMEKERQVNGADNKKKGETDYQNESDSHTPSY